MKQSLLLLCLLLLTPVLRAQSSSDIHLKVYDQALERGDVNAAVIAVQYIIAEGKAEGNWEDTLARLYFSAGQYPLARKISEKLLRTDPKNVPMLTIAAFSNKALGQAKEAIPLFEVLYQESKYPGNLYELITLQFALKRYGEAAENIEALLKDPKAGEIKTTIQVGNNPPQEVALNAAALNIKGVIALEMGNKEDAERIFAEALEIMPDFVLAKQNMAVLQATKGKQEEETPAADAPESGKGKSKSKKRK